MPHETFQNKEIQAPVFETMQNDMWNCHLVQASGCGNSAVSLNIVPVFQAT